MIERTVISAVLTFRSKAEGGRMIPPAVLTDLQYRPHIVIGDRHQSKAIIGPDRVIAEEYLGVVFTAGPKEVPVGKEVQVEMMLAYWPNLGDVGAISGATFTGREGPRIGGHGAITGRRIERLGAGG